MTQDNNEANFLTDDEIDLLILAGADDPNGVTEDEAEVIIRWAHGTRVRQTILKLLLERHLTAYVDEDSQVWVRIRREQNSDGLAAVQANVASDAVGRSIGFES